MGETNKKESNQDPSWALLAPRHAGAWLLFQECKVLLMASFHSQRQTASWAPLPEPGSEAAQSVAILNPLKSRPELQLPKVLKSICSDTDLPKDSGGRWGHILSDQLNSLIADTPHPPKSLLSSPSCGGEADGLSGLRGSSPLSLHPKFFSTPQNIFKLLLLHLQNSLPPAK